MKISGGTSYILACAFILRGVAAFRALSPQVGSMARSAPSSFMTRVAASSDESQSHTLSIEYCTGCRWMLKSFWMAQELLTTFEEDLDAVTVIPSSTKGVFAVRLDGNSLLWDRKEQGGFPTPKGLKQIVRDMVEPEKFLGHSDTEDRQSGNEGEVAVRLPEVAAGIVREEKDISLKIPDAPEPTVTIYYCTGCRWLLRAAYFGQELLTTFSDEIKSVTLVPSKPPAKGGRFSIELNGELLFDRATEGRFPEVKEIKQMIRDTIDPEKDLGHSDVVSEEEAAEQRKFFGVD